jgi:hypothetical protein
LLVPPLGFLLYRAIENVTNFLLAMLHLTSDNAALMAFFAVFALISAAVAVTPKQQTKSSTRRLPCHSRLAFHIFAVLGLMTLAASAPGVAQRRVLLPLALLIWALDALWQRHVLKCETKNYGTQRFTAN